MLHNETRKLLIEALNKTHNAKEVVECFSANFNTIYHLAEQIKATGLLKPETARTKTFIHSR